MTINRKQTRYGQCHCGHPAGTTRGTDSAIEAIGIYEPKKEALLRSAGVYEQKIAGVPLALEDNALPEGSLNEDENMGVRGIQISTREPKVQHYRQYAPPEWIFE
jgi:hypothetical protein